MTGSNLTPMSVTKTLVIGLGSTGTRVCNGILRRLEWDYGSASRAPWVQFMAIETNNNEPTPLKQRGDFFPIGLDPKTYSQIMQAPEDSKKIRLESWADMNTLRRMKDTQDGAGNIRMVGRLTFMTDPNYTNIKLALLDRLSNLRKLSESDAWQARGTLQDGSNPTISYGSGGDIRVFVVGTLCGGTGSGLSPDFGYFVRSLLKQEEKIIGIFTLPHEKLTPSITANADKLKRNAYHALLELNHYHQSSADNMPPITYPDGASANLALQPYDLPYLVSPDSETKKDENALNELVADRIYMNIFIQDADPFSKAVDAPLPEKTDEADRDHQAHVFSTFGLSAVEFPAPQITEAASKKLLHGALTEWQSFKAQRVSDLTYVIGLEDSALKSALLQKDAGDWASDAVKSAVSELAEGKTDFSKFDRALGALRMRIAPDGELSNDLRRRREYVVEAIYQNFTQHAQKALLDRTYGPQVLAVEVDHLLTYVRALHEAAREFTAVGQSETGEAWRKVDQSVTSFRAELKRKSFLNPNRDAIKTAQTAIDTNIRAFTKLQIQLGVQASLQSYQTYGTIDFGVAESIERLLTTVQTNLRKLNDRITALRNNLYREYEAKDSELPPVNGLVLFEPRSTVQREYERALAAERTQSILNLGNMEAEMYEEIISSWKTLPAVIAPPKQSLEAGWIGADFNPRGDHLIPAADLKQLLAVAKRPFVKALAQDNVIERVMRDRETNAGIDSKVKDAAGRSKPFLSLNKNKAVQGNRSPVLERQSLLMPPRTNPVHDTEFRKLVAGVFSSSNTVNLVSPDPTRALFLEEYFRFPLRGLDQVLGDGGLHTAECNDFPTFHTRRDVNWYGLSKREGKMLADAEEAIVIGVLLGELDIRNGLILPWTMSGFGDREYRRLPANLTDAARVLARGDTDQDGFSLMGALPTLQESIEKHWQRHDLNLEESSIAFIGLLRDKLAAFYRQGRQGQIQDWGSQQWAGDRISIYTAKHTALHEAAMQLFPPPASRINMLTLRKDQQGKWGGHAPKDGLYCPSCGGEIGADIKEAAQNGWRCFRDSSHYYGA